jgi:transcriptional regulator NrdR family protein
LYRDGKLDQNDIADLDRLRNSITDEYARGKISREQFDQLVDDISIRYQEIFRKEIDSVMIAPSKGDKIKELNQIKYDIEDACAKGKISELRYNLRRRK